MRGVVVCVYVSASVRTVLDASCIRVCLSVSESVRPTKIFVNTIFNKPLKRISPYFGGTCNWVHTCTD